MLHKETGWNVETRLRDFPRGQIAWQIGNWERLSVSKTLHARIKSSVCNHGKPYGGEGARVNLPSVIPSVRDYCCCAEILLLRALRRLIVNAKQHADEHLIDLLYNFPLRDSFRFSSAQKVTTTACLGFARVNYLCRNFVLRRDT